MEILVAEDDADQLALRCAVLARHGFVLHPACDLKTALSLARQHRPACALLDLRFPTEELGFELVEKLKRLDPAMHIVLLTGASRSRIDAWPLRHLVDQVLAKGSSSAALVKHLKALAERTKPAA